MCNYRLGFFLPISSLVLIVSSVWYAGAAAQENGPQVKDQNLVIELVTSDLEAPTTMAFIGLDDLLVVEKDKGTVQRIVGGKMLDDPLLDVNVNSKLERGMLGIAVSRNETSDKTYVFLYYTEGEGDEDGGEPIANRLYRYELSDSGDRLVNPKLLLDLPYQSGPSHNGGFLTIGPDNNVYLTLGDLTETRYAGTDYDTLAQNIQDSRQADGRAGILRVTQEGKVVNNEGILGDEHPLDMYYAYGIRNSFGIAFDPVNGNLWETENGHKFGDEINLVEPGFNSGWIKVQGVWKVEQSIDDEGKREIRKGIIVSTDPQDLIDFNGHGSYSEPEFTWGYVVVPTSLVFISSDNFGESYQNDLLVASLLGTIFHFKLNEERNELVLINRLSDKVAFDQEIEEDKDYQNLIFGTGLGTITDLEIGPDGNLYVLTGVREAEGKIYKILPAED